MLQDIQAPQVLHTSAQLLIVGFDLAEHEPSEMSEEMRRPNGLALRTDCVQPDAHPEVNIDKLEEMQEDMAELMMDHEEIQEVTSEGPTFPFIPFGGL